MNRENNKTAIILGASGLIGSLLLNHLLESSHYQRVIIFVRKGLGITHPKLIEHCIDFDRIETYKNLVNGDDLYCCLGTTIKTAGSKQAFRKVDLDYPTIFAKLSKENNIRQFLIVTSMGANPNSSFFYMKTKGECEQAIKSTGVESISIFRPASLYGKRKEFRLSETISLPVLKFLSILFVGKLRKHKPIAASQVAKAMFKIAQSNIVGYSIYESDQIQFI